MKNNQLIFQGSVCAYLQGKYALAPISYPNFDLMSYYVGNESTNLVVNEHRQKVNEVAYHALMNRDDQYFYTVFNQPAWAEIWWDDASESMEINLFQSTTQMNIPILWLGSLDDNLMPGYKVEWEVLKPLNSTSTAFVALLAHSTADASESVDSPDVEFAEAVDP